MAKLLNGSEVVQNNLPKIGIDMLNFKKITIFI